MHYKSQLVELTAEILSMEIVNPTTNPQTDTNKLSYLDTDLLHVNFSKHQTK